jgi:hypothetical protein
MYDAAKAGDAAAANLVVRAVIQPELVEAIGQTYRSAVVASVHAEEAAGRNKLPQMYAVAIADIGGLHEPTQLVVTERTVVALEQKFDVIRLDAILRDHGTAPTIRHLTEAQGRTLLGFGSIDAIRSCLASGRQA